MPTNWDDLLNWNDIGFSPNYQQQPQPQQQGMFRSAFGEMPEYDYSPMQRYKDYLGTEPLREQHRPGKFRNVVNSLSAGLESMETNLGRGTQLYDMLTDRDYNQAYKSWANRATKYKADVDLENTRYRNATTDYDRRVDNERQNRSVDIAGRNADTAFERLQLERDKYEQQGYTLTDGPNGSKAWVRMRDGQQEVVPSNIPNTRLTAQELIAQEDRRRDDAMTRHTTPSGSAALAARTATRNTDARIGAAATEGDKDRSTDIWRHTTRSASMTEPKKVVDVPSQTNTAPKLLAVFPEFDDPKLVMVDGDGFVPQSLETSNPEEFARLMQEKAARLGIPLRELGERWKEFKTRATPLAVRSRSRQ
jgi:hypothetical protein